MKEEVENKNRWEAEDEIHEEEGVMVKKKLKQGDKLRKDYNQVREEGEDAKGQE
jgi:hypothetical protein